MNEKDTPQNDIKPEPPKPEAGPAWPSFSPRDTQPGQMNQENPAEQNNPLAPVNPTAPSPAPWQGYQQHGMSAPPAYPQINIPPQVPPQHNPPEPPADYMTPPGYPADNPYAAPGSSPPPPGYPHYPGGMPPGPRDPYNMASPDYVPPVKRKRSKAPIIASIAVLVAAAVAVVVVFGDTLLRTVSPEAYLALAIARTIDNIADTPSAFPNLDRFEGQAMSHQVDVDITDIISDATGFSLPGMTTNAVFSALTDWENENFMLGLSVDTPFFSIPDNQIFLSPDTIGVSIPILLGQYGFITVDPATFTEEWNNSAYADIFGELMDDFDLSQMLDVFFADMRGKEIPLDELPPGSTVYEAAILVESLTAEFELLVDKLTESIRIESLGSIGGHSHIRVSAPAYAATQFIRESSAAIFDFTIEYYMLIDEDLANWLAANGMDEVMYIFDRLHFNDDLIIDFTIGRNGLISGIYIPDTSFEMPTGIPGDIVTLTFGHETIFGEVYVLQGMESFTFIADDNGSEVALFLENFTQITQDYIYDGWDIYIEFFDYGEFYGDIVLSYYFQWLKNEQQNDNMTISFMLVNGLDSVDDVLELEITGILIETPNRTELSFGILSFTVSDDSFSVGFGYRAQPVSPREVSIAGQRSTDLFSISFDDLLSDLGLFGDLLDMLELATMFM